MLCPVDYLTQPYCHNSLKSLNSFPVSPLVLFRRTSRLTALETGVGVGNETLPRRGFKTWQAILDTIEPPQAREPLPKPKHHEPPRGSRRRR